MRNTRPPKRERVQDARKENTAAPGTDGLEPQQDVAADDAVRTAPNEDADAPVQDKTQHLTDPARQKRARLLMTEPLSSPPPKLGYVRGHRSRDDLERTVGDHTDPEFEKRAMYDAGYSEDDEGDFWTMEEARAAHSAAYTKLAELEAQLGILEVQRAAARSYCQEMDFKVRATRDRYRRNRGTWSGSVRLWRLPADDEPGPSNRTWRPVTRKMSRRRTPASGEDEYDIRRSDGDYGDVERDSSDEDEDEDDDEDEVDEVSHQEGRGWSAKTDSSSSDASAGF